MRRSVLGAAGVLLMVPGIAYAGDFPGLVEMLISALIAIALVLGFLTEGLLAFLKHRPMRWQRGLACAALWFVGILILMWLRRA